MKRGRHLTVQDLGRIELSPVPNKSGHDPDLWNTLKRQEAEENAAAERAAFLASPQGQHETLLQQNEKSLRKFWSLPWSQLREFDRRDFPIDFVGDYALMTSVGTLDEETAILGQFLDGLDAQGITFPENDECRPGLLRFLSYFTSLRQRTIAMTRENLTQALQRLVYGLRAYESNPGELSGTVPMPEWAKPVDQVSQGETEVQRRARIANQIEHGKDIEAKELVGLEFSQDIQRAFYAWVDENMVPVWSVARDIMTSPRITRFVGQVLDRNPERNALRPQTWDFVRRAIDHAQLLGPRGRYLTADERTAASLEETTLTNANFETRQDIVRRLSALQE